MNCGFPKIGRRFPQMMLEPSPPKKKCGLAGLASHPLQFSGIGGGGLQPQILTGLPSFYLSTQMPDFLIFSSFDYFISCILPLNSGVTGTISGDLMKSKIETSDVSTPSCEYSQTALYIPIVNVEKQP